MQKEKSSVTIRSTKWGLMLFYILIVFEFLYMASPFAVYFYSAYSPGLEFLIKSPYTAWLTAFFLPHVVEDTSSILINAHNYLGMFFVLIGFSSFIVGAVHIYFNKIFRKKAVTGGIYKYIRHPQYLSFAVSSFGMLLLWPRYLVLIMFITVLFVYYFLAKHEEKECVEKFGNSYLEYVNRTGMFFPVKRINVVNRLPFLKSFIKKRSGVLIIYLILIFSSLGLARIIQHVSINSLYSHNYKNSLFVSIKKLNVSAFEKIISTVIKSDQVEKLLADDTKLSEKRFINYVLPAEMYISEIPMNTRGINEQNHFLSATEITDSTVYKVIFTKPIAIGDSIPSNENLLVCTYSIMPLFEVWVDTQKDKVIKVTSLPKDKRYGNTPIPIY